MDKTALKHKILTLEGLTNEEKSALLELLNKQKKYGLVWEEKPEDVEERLRDSLPVFKEVKDRAILSDSPEAPNHILIEGDNLEALTALSYTHEGKIDVIYIDPPYNTGNKDFIYNDSFVDSEDGYRHSKWLSFMSKRLKIAKRLLSLSGVIFISIDDNEYCDLKLLCDDIFMPYCYVATICRQAIKGGTRALNIKTVHDYVLIYASHIESLKQFTGEEKEAIKFELSDEKGPFTKGRELNKWGAGSRREDSPSMWFPIKGPNGIDVYPLRNDGSEGRWRWGKKKLLKAVEDGDVLFELRDNGTYIAYEKVREQKTMTKQFNTWFADNYINAKGSESVKAIFATLMSVFSYAKPVELIKDLFFMSNNPEGIFLDFFAGSGTTLHATMQLNSEDGGHRQCILVTNNENKICEEVTYERNKRVINGYTTPKGEQVEGLKNNSLRYYKTELLPREKSPRNMRALMAAATELLCIKEDLYEESKRFGRYRTNPKTIRYFEKGNKRMLIIFCEELADQIAEEIKTLDFGGDKLKIYIFSPDRYAFNDNFYEVQDKVTLVALPAAIYDAYRRVLPKRIDKPLLEIVEGERLTSTVAAGETHTLPEAAQQSIDFNFE